MAPILQVQGSYISEVVLAPSHVGAPGDLGLTGRFALISSARPFNLPCSIVLIGKVAPTLRPRANVLRSRRRIRTSIDGLVYEYHALSPHFSPIATIPPSATSPTPDSFPHSACAVSRRCSELCIHLRQQRDPSSMQLQARLCLPIRRFRSRNIVLRERLVQEDTLRGDTRSGKHNL